MKKLGLILCLVLFTSCSILKYGTIKLTPDQEIADDVVDSILFADLGDKLLNKDKEDKKSLEIKSKAVKIFSTLKEVLGGYSKGLDVNTLIKEAQKHDTNLDEEVIGMAKIALKRILGKYKVYVNPDYDNQLERIKNIVNEICIMLED